MKTLENIRHDVMDYLMTGIIPEDYSEKQSEIIKSCGKTLHEFHSDFNMWKTAVDNTSKRVSELF